MTYCLEFLQQTITNAVKQAVAVVQAITMPSVC